MKLTFLIVLITSLQVSAHVKGQEVFSLNVSHVPINKVLNKIQKESDYRFFYNDKYLKHLNPVHLDIKNATLAEVMDQLLDSTLSYKVIDKNLVVISPKDQLGYLQHEVSGTVTDTAGTPLIGVTIKVKGTTTGTVTDAEGKFTLVVPEDATLEVSSVGYVTREISVGKRTNLDIQLKTSATGLNQLVVVGYGTQKKVDLTGAVTQIGDKMLKDRPISNVGQALQGVVPNLNINFSDGRPGAPAKINIRGFTSVNGGQPLVLIDGVPGDINLVNPNDVESISVLKDASSAAIYGSRAAYGVILVTTKSGKSGKLQVTYSANFATSTPTTSHSFITDGYTALKLMDSAYKISKGNIISNYTQADYEELKKRQRDPSLPSVVIQNRSGRDQYVYYGSTDWWNYVFNKTLPSMSHSLQFSGGSDHITFRVSGRYYEQKGMMKFAGDKYTDYNLRAKVKARIKPWLTIDNNLSFDANVYNWPGSLPINDAFIYLGVSLHPYMVPRNPDGTLVYTSGLNTETNGYLLELESGKAASQQKQFDLTNNFTVTLTPVPGLSIEASYSYNLNPYSSYNRNVETPYSIFPGVINTANNDTYNERLNLDQYHVASAHATYQKRVGLHSFKVMGGYDQEFKKYHVLYGSGNNLLSQDLNALDLATSGQTVGSNSVAWALLGFFGRINYSYNDKYLLELDGRYDGSSHFPAATRFGFFPSASVGWRVSEEPFFSPVKGIISELKLRGSYGSLGNQSLSTNLRNDNYPYIPLMSTGLSGWLQNGDKSQYLQVGAPVPPELTWEHTLSVNGGIDMGLFEDRLSLSFDLYDRKTLNMLVEGPTLPAVFGAGSPKANAADLDTKGWELSVKWTGNTQVAGKPLTFNAGVVLSNFTSHITKYNNPSYLLNNYYVGEKVGGIWGYTVDGYFKSDAEAKGYQVNQDFVNSTRMGSSGVNHSLQAGDMKFVDINGDGVVNNGKNTLADHGDLSIIGNNLPRMSFGVNGSINWNGFDLSAFFQGIGHQDWYPNTQTWLFWGVYGRPYFSFYPTDFQEKMWGPDNPNAYFPRLRGYVANSSSSELGVANDKYIQNIAYIRLKNLTIGYNLPSTLLQKWKIENIRVYLSGENIFTVTGLDSKYIDPEQVSADPNGAVANVSARNYPFMKSYSFGFDVTF